MSYVSDVAIALSVQDYERMLSVIPGESLALWVDADVKTIVRTDGSQFIVLHWLNQKWYRGHIAIDAIETFISSIPHEFLRSGEELEDVEHYNTTCYNSMLFVEKQLMIYP